MSSFSFNFGGAEKDDVQRDPVVETEPKDRSSSKRRRVEEVFDSTQPQQLRRSPRNHSATKADPLLAGLKKESSKVMFNNGVYFHVVSSQLAENEISVSIAERCAPSDTDTSSDVLAASAMGSDLVPNIYEGGMKVWEGTGDLVNTLSVSNISWGMKRVIELGCGAGLPGIYALSRGAQVDFADYNVEVLKHITCPNVRLNAAEANISGYTSRFLSGDWNNLVKYLQSQEERGKGHSKYDIVLTSETLYSKDSGKVLYDIIKGLLAKPHGIAYIASKTYYFGVGGGTDDFVRVVEGDSLFSVETTYKSVGGVQREVLKMSWRSQ